MIDLMPMAAASMLPSSCHLRSPGTLLPSAPSSLSQADPDPPSIPANQLARIEKSCGVNVRPIHKCRLTSGHADPPNASAASSCTLTGCVPIPAPRSTCPAFQGSGLKPVRNWSSSPSGDTAGLGAGAGSVDAALASALIVVVGRTPCSCARSTARWRRPVNGCEGSVCQLSSCTNPICSSSIPAQHLLPAADSQ